MNKVIYAKYSNQRRDKFNICTKIMVRDGEKLAVKTPLTQKAKAHLIDMASYYEPMQALLACSKLDAVLCRKNEDSLEFDYIEGTLFETAMQQYYQSNHLDALLNEWKIFANLLSGLNNQSTFRPTPQFVEIFGDIHFQEPLDACDFSNLDITPNNIIIKADGRMVLIDYEWCFPFPIPTKFILYRALNNFLNKYPCADMDIFAELDILPENKKLFEQMESKFSDYVNLSEKQINTAPVPKMLKEHFNVTDSRFLQIASNTHSSNLFLDYGEGFTEANRMEKRNTVLSPHHFMVQFTLEEPSSIQCLRFDPIESRPTQIKIDSVVIDGTEGSALPLNATGTNGDFTSFEHLDPSYQIGLLNDDKEKIKEIQVIYQLHELEPLSLVHKHHDSINRLKLEKQEAENTAEGLRHALAGLQHALQEEENASAALRQALQEEENTSEGLRRELQNTRTHLESLQNVHEAVVNSKFWKLTWPLRRLCAIFKKS